MKDRASSAGAFPGCTRIISLRSAEPKRERIPPLRGQWHCRVQEAVEIAFTSFCYNSAPFTSAYSNSESPRQEPGQGRSSSGALWCVGWNNGENHFAVSCRVDSRIWKRDERQHCICDHRSYWLGSGQNGHGSISLPRGGIGLQVIPLETTRTFLLVLVLRLICIHSHLLRIFTGLVNKRRRRDKQSHRRSLQYAPLPLG